MSIIGWGMISGILPVQEKNMLTSLSVQAWGTSLIVFVMIGVALIAIPQMFLTRLKESLTLLDKHAESLERSNASLKETIKAREDGGIGKIADLFPNNLSWHFFVSGLS